MRKPINLVGQKFGRLIVILRKDNDQWSHHCWLCQCNCGKEVTVRGNDLRNNRVQSCGCLKTKRNCLSTTKTYYAWADLIKRCNDPNNISYKNYGNRGITVCDRWQEKDKGFCNFLEDMGNPPSKKYSIDRIKNNENYCKSNCRWATRKEQSRNTRRNRLISFNGKTQCLADWAIEYKIDYTRLWRRIYQLNWPIKKALTKPVRKQRRKKK